MYYARNMEFDMILPKTWDDMSDTTRKSLERMLKTCNNMPLQGAINMLCDILKREPELIPAREKLRELEIRKAEESSAAPEKGLTTFILSCKTTFTGSNYFRAIELCEEVLAKNINNIPTLKMLASFAEKAEAHFISADAIQCAIHFAPEDTDLRLQLGYIYLKAKDLEKSQEIFQALFDSDPEKSAYKRGMRDINAAIEAREAAELRKQEEELKKSQEKKIQSRNSNEAIIQQLLEGTIRDKEQANLVITELSKVLEQKESLDIRRKLAEAYKIAENYDDAIRHLEYVSSALKTFDIALDKEIEKLYLKKYDITIKAIADNPGAYENPQEQLDNLEISRIQFKLDRAIRRVKYNPKDAQLHYELGVGYYECNMAQEAMEEFTAAERHPKWTPLCNYYSGRIQLNLDNIPAAVEYLAKASETLNTREPNFKKCLYYLGIAYEKNGDAENAKKAYEQLYKIDPAFLDVANRIA